MRSEDVKKLAAELMQIEVKFVDLQDNKEKGLIFYRYEDFGKWYADNYDIVKVLEVIQYE